MSRCVLLWRARGQRRTALSWNASLMGHFVPGWSPPSPTRSERRTSSPPCMPGAGRSSRSSTNRGPPALAPRRAAFAHPGRRLPRGVGLPARALRGPGFDPLRSPPRRPQGRPDISHGATQARSRIPMGTSGWCGQNRCPRLPDIGAERHIPEVPPEDRATVASSTSIQCGADPAVWGTGLARSICSYHERQRVGKAPLIAVAQVLDLSVGRTLPDSFDSACWATKSRVGCTMSSPPSSTTRTVELRPSRVANKHHIHQNTRPPQNHGNNLRHPCLRRMNPGQTAKVH